jgi:hypothetical protein
VSSAVGYLLFALVTIPLWWPALRVLLAEIRAAADSEPLLPPSSPARSAPLPLVTPWSTTRTRLAALAAARQTGSARRWEGGFGRRSP